jgi:hypothetical protein
MEKLLSLTSKSFCNLTVKVKVVVCSTNPTVPIIDESLALNVKPVGRFPETIKIFPNGSMVYEKKKENNVPSETVPIEPLGVNHSIDDIKKTP